VFIPIVMMVFARFPLRPLPSLAHSVLARRFSSDSEIAAIIARTQQAFRDSPAAAAAAFSATSVQAEGLRCDVRMRQHKMTLDEPADLGRNEGPSPAEVMMMALGTCQEITFKAYSTAMGMSLDSVAVTVRGSVDWRKAYGIDSPDPSGFTAVSTQVLVSSAAGLADLKQLQQAVDAHCPVLDMFSRSVKVVVNVDCELSAGSEPHADLAVAVQQRKNVVAANVDGHSTLSSMSMLTEGLKTVARVGEHEHVVDEPTDLGGTDTGPNPVELVLAGLCSSLQMTFKKLAAEAGVGVDTVVSKAKGDIDLRGFFAVDESVPPGFHTITVNVVVSSPAAADVIKQLHAKAVECDPVMHLVTGRPPMDLGEVDVSVA